MRLIPPILALAVAAVPGTALACTVPAGYTAPTNWQLANDANTILLGEVVGGGVGSPADPAASTITVHPIVALKGLLPGADFKIAGVSLADGTDAAAGPPDDALAFAAPDPAALGDACIRRVFAPNTQALFFLKRENGQWAPAGGPLSRWAQDVSGLDAPWVELASVYAHASMVPGEDGRQLLEQRHEALVSRPDDPQAAAMAADLERSLAGPPAPVIAEATLEPPDEAATGAQATPEPSAPHDLGEVQDAIDSFGKGH
jgi:hypothetical protein